MLGLGGLGGLGDEEWWLRYARLTNRSLEAADGDVNKGNNELMHSRASELERLTMGTGKSYRGIVGIVGIVEFWFRQF